jgi:hypothetical protein
MRGHDHQPVEAVLVQADVRPTQQDRPRGLASVLDGLRGPDDFGGDDRLQPRGVRGIEVGDLPRPRRGGGRARTARAHRRCFGRRRGGRGLRLRRHALSVTSGGTSVCS